MTTYCDAATTCYVDDFPFFVRVPFPRTNAASSRPSPAVELAAPRPSRPTRAGWREKP